MAITYTGERDIVVGGSGAFNLVFTNVVPSSGDLLVLTIGTGSGSAFTQSWSAVTGAGWTLAASSNPANESKETHAAIFYKISDGTETGINVDIGANSPVVTATRWAGNATSEVLDAVGYDNSEADAPTGVDAYSGAASSTADGAAIALVVWKDQRFAEDGTNSASNSFTIIQDIDPANHGGVTNNANPVIAWLAYTGSASRSTTITTTDTGDENAGVIALFKAAGGGASISGALESISLATFGATVASARDIAAALESVALTTSAARVSTDRAVTAAVESISITTNAATVQAGSDTAISAGLESLTLTGHQASIATDRNVAATLEAITVTGLTATVSTSSNTNISATLESITVTVNPATVSRDSALAAALESLTVTPHAASIAVGQIVAAALESLTLTSYPAGIALDVAVAAQIEQINLATFAAQVGLGTNVAALTEALTLTPHGATLTFTSNIGAATEHLTLTTFAAVVGASEAALLSPGLEFTIPLNRLGYTIPIGRIHFTIPQE